LESVALLELLPGSLDLQPPLSLLLLSNPLLLLSSSLLLPHLGLPHQLVRDDLGQSVQVQLDEHVEGVLLSVLWEAGELSLAELLQFWTEGQVLLVKLLLLVPGESLPRCGVREGRKSQLLVLQLLRYGQPLSGGQHQGVGVTEVNVAQMSDESFPLLARKPWWRGRGGGGGCCGCCGCSGCGCWL